MRDARFGPKIVAKRQKRWLACSTNTIEGLNARIRRAVRARGYFPTEQAGLKCVYMAVTGLDSTGTGANAG